MASSPISTRRERPSAVRDVYKRQRESDASLVSAVASFADVKISHVVKIDAAGLVQLVRCV